VVQVDRVLIPSPDVDIGIHRLIFGGSVDVPAR
jgi:hypothetical protein